MPWIPCREHRQGFDPEEGYDGFVTAKEIADTLNVNEGTE